MDYCIYNEQTGDKAEVRLPRFVGRRERAVQPRGVRRHGGDARRTTPLP